MVTALQIERLRESCRLRASDVLGHYPENEDSQRLDMSVAEGDGYVAFSEQ